MTWLKMVKIPTRVVFIVRTIHAYPPPSPCGWMWPELGQLPDWIFLRRAPFVPYPFCPRSSSSNDIINGLAGELATSRERDRAGYNRERIKYGCAGSPRQEVAFPSENGLREIFWIQRGWPTKHPPSLSHFFPFLYASSIYALSLSPRSLRHRLTVRRIHEHSSA